MREANFFLRYSEVGGLAFMSLKRCSRICCSLAFKYCDLGTTTPSPTLTVEEMDASPEVLVQQLLTDDENRQSLGSDVASGNIISMVVCSACQSLSFKIPNILSSDGTE